MTVQTWTAEEQKEHRRLWVEALRSGTLKQTIGELRNSGGFCCLGVACEISGLGHWDDARYITTQFHHEGTLEADVKNWLGLNGDEGEFWRTSIDQTSLALLNDHEHKTFAEIADIIESEPEGLIAKAQPE